MNKELLLTDILVKVWEMSKASQEFIVRRETLNWAKDELDKTIAQARAEERAKALKEVAKVFDETCAESDEEKYMCPRCMRQLRDALKSGTTELPKSARGEVMNKEWLLTDNQIADTELPTFEEVRKYQTKYEKDIEDTFVSRYKGKDVNIAVNILAALMLFGSKVAQAQHAQTSAHYEKKIADDEKMTAEIMEASNATIERLVAQARADAYYKCWRELQAGKSPIEQQGEGGSDEDRLASNPEG